MIWNNSLIEKCDNIDFKNRMVMGPKVKSSVGTEQEQ